MACGNLLLEALGEATAGGIGGVSTERLVAERNIGSKFVKITD